MISSYLAFDLTVRSDFPLYELPPSDLEPDIEIRRSVIDRPKLERTSLVRHDIEALFGGKPDAATIHWPDVATMQALDGRVLMIHPARDEVDPMILSAYICSEALGLVLHQRGRFLLHASAVAIRGEAVVFAGPPGAGKSTLAAACDQRGHLVLSDDMVVIEGIGEGGPPRVIPGASIVKAWPDAVEALGSKPELHPIAVPNSSKRLVRSSIQQPRAALPLRQVVFVEPSQRYSFAPARPLDAIHGLTRYFPCPSGVLAGAGQITHLRSCESLCSRVPMWTMGRPDDFDALRRVIDRLELGAE